MPSIRPVSGVVLLLTNEGAYWDDLDFAMTIRSQGNEGPTLVDLNNTGIYGWAFGNGKAAYFQRQLSHAFKANQRTWKPHVHWMPITTATRTGTFNVAATAWQGHLTPLNLEGPIDGIDWKISTIIYCKIAVTLTSGASIVLSGMDWHGEKDSFGSVEEYTK